VSPGRAWFGRGGIRVAGGGRPRSRPVRTDEDEDRQHL